MAGRRSTPPVADPWDTAVPVTTARVSCGNCGPVIAPFDDLELVVLAGAIWYQFGCPTCGRANTVATTPYATDLLVMSGIRIHLIDPPREIDEAHPVRPWTPAEIDAVLGANDALDPSGP
jgi:hypothetical protein